MANWGEIPRDIAEQIPAHLEFYEDCETFGQVCSRWRLAWKETCNRYKNKNKQPPWLMLADVPECPYRRYYNLVNGMTRKIDLPSLVVADQDDDPTRRYLSSRGWVMSITQKNRKLTLFSPLSGKVIQLPPAPPLDELGEDYEDREDELEWVQVILFSKFILSKTPSNNDSNDNDDDLEVAFILDGYDRIAFWRYGEESWTMKKLDFKLGWCHDVCFFRGEFYTFSIIQDDLQVMAMGSDKYNRPPRIVDHLSDIVFGRNILGEIKLIGDIKLYLLEGGLATLLLVIRYILRKDDLPYTSCFHVFEFNVDTKECKKLKSLGNKAIFVGNNSTFSVVASDNDERGCKPDCIYFTDDYAEFYLSNNTGGRDMGVYSLAQSKVIEPPPYHGPSRLCQITPPMWVESNRLA